MKIQPTVKNQKNHSEYIKFKNTLRNIAENNFLKFQHIYNEKQVS